MRTLFLGVSVLVLVGCSEQTVATEPNEVSKSAETAITSDQSGEPDLEEIVARIQEEQARRFSIINTCIDLCEYSNSPVHSESEVNRNNFGVLTDLVGTRMRGTPTDGSTERAADIQQWEWALGGTAILIRHALEDGSYGGDTYVYKDAASDELVYVYITNAGFRTEGVMRVNEDESFTAEEDVSGHESITKVRSTSVINDDGSTSMTSEYLSNGEWVPGHAFTYVPTDKPLPVLKPKTPDAE